MESGALNGFLFSNSLMFEKFANWTALNVGKDRFAFQKVNPLD